MTGLNVGDIFTRVQRTFGDEASIQVTSSDVIRWINDAQHEIVMQHDGLLNTITNSTTFATLDAYNYPYDMISIKKVYYKTANGDKYNPLKFMSSKEMEESFPDWIANPTYGTPQFYTQGWNNTLVLIPAPDESGAQIKWVYNRYPVDVTSLNSALDLPEYYHLTVLEYCLMKAYEMDEDWESADRKAQYIQSTIDFNSNREAWFEKQTYPSIVTTGEDYV